MSRRKSSMSHTFSRAPQASLPRSTFARHCDYKTTFDAGYLVPIFCDFAFPGDTYNLRMTALGRLSTAIAPFMDNLFLETFFFAVPIRILWENFERMCGAQDNPTDSTDFLMPVIDAPEDVGFSPLTIYDYFGIPPGVSNFSVNALPFRAYNKIINDWFRDENLQDSLTEHFGDGPDLDTDYELVRRCKRYDYFTSALPWPQKGDAVSIPLIGDAPVFLDPSSVSPGLILGYTSHAPALPGVTDYLNLRSVGGGAAGAGSMYAFQGTGPNMEPIVYDPNGTLLADLSNVTAVTVNDLREAFQMQRLLERDARGGTRFVEILQSHFGVTSPDARLQRPEYLGGGKSYINLHPIAQTSATDTESPQANLSAYGTVIADRHGFVKSFVEHSIVIGLVSVRSDLTYQQGLERHWSYRSRYDLYWPVFAHLGEQAILNKEIYLQGTSADEDVFGYQERYAELRYKNSLITGQFRSDYAQSLDYWHLSQDFSALPTLSSDFIEEDPPLDRVLAVDQDQSHILFDAHFDFVCARSMPTYSVPGLIDHF